MTYQELKQKQREELDRFEGIFFAFNNEQFKEGMEKVGLQVTETSKIYRLAGGGFILKDRSQAFKTMFENHAAEMKKLKQDRKEQLAALTYELQNHEYIITGDIHPALEALGWTVADVDQDILKQAKNAAMA